MNNPLGQSCRAQISSTCFICSQVIIQKSVFRILHGYSIFLAEIATPSIQKSFIIDLLYVCSLLSGFSLFSVFWPILGELVCKHISNSTTDSSSRIVLCRAKILYYDLTSMDIYGFLWVSLALLRN